MAVKFSIGFQDHQEVSMALEPLISNIPLFRPDGYLPEGVYVCSEAEVIFHFGSSGRRRRRLVRRLRR